MATPKPRVAWSLVMGGRATVPSVWPDGTWLEDESMTYPSGGYHRRAYARCPDGTLRVFRAAVADSFFSIPARGRVAGRYVAGFLTSSEGGLTFTPNRKDGG